MQPQIISLGIRVIDDFIVIDDDPAFDGLIDVSWFMPEIRCLRDAMTRAVPEARFVAGGAAFSYFPLECLDFL